MAISNNRFVGEDKFIWWLGDVEDVMDPEKLGRVKVRVFGYHTEKFLTEDLPWATPISSIQSASLTCTINDQVFHGVGLSPTGIEVGSWVFGFWADHDRTRSPIIVGTLAAFRDNPDAAAQRDSDRIHDVHPLAREVNVWDTIKTLLGPEPKTTYNTKYPLNKVFATRTGHVVEIDDTEGAERIHIYHKSGTYIEVSSDGRTVTKVTGNNYVIHAQNDEIHVQGNVHVHVVGNVLMEVDKNFEMQVGGTCKIQSGGTMTLIGGPDIQLNP